MSKKRRFHLLLGAFLVIGLCAPIWLTGIAFSSSTGPVQEQNFKLDNKAPGYKAVQFDAAPQIKTYAEVVYRTYRHSYEMVAKMQSAIAKMLARPNAKTLAAARFAWLNARAAYLQTEVFRFYGGPIDFADPNTGEEGPEGHINAWPINEAFVDYVKGNPKAGLINDPSFILSYTSILDKDQVSDEVDATTGWHTIEFLLWGQDLNAAGPGERSASDYVTGKGNNDRRRKYLKIVTQMLVDNLKWLAGEWEPGKANNYAAKFLKMDQREALGRILTGIGALSAFEMASERMAVPLDSGDQEDEHSCFSDNTREDFVNNQRGIRNVYFGVYGDYSGQGLDQLLQSLSPALNRRMTQVILQTESLLAGIIQPFDQILITPKGSSERKQVEKAIASLRAQGEIVKEIGSLLGTKVLIPTA